MRNKLVEPSTLLIERIKKSQLKKTILKEGLNIAPSHENSPAKSKENQ